MAAVLAVPGVLGCAGACITLYLASDAHDMDLTTTLSGVMFL